MLVTHDPQRIKAGEFDDSGFGAAHILGEQHSSAVKAPGKLAEKATPVPPVQGSIVGHADQGQQAVLR
jgi:hypothetical protein